MTLTDVRVLRQAAEDVHLRHDGLLHSRILRLVDDLHRELLPRFPRHASPHGAREASARKQTPIVLRIGKARPTRVNKMRRQAPASSMRMQRRSKYSLAEDLARFVLHVKLAVFAI